MRSNYPYGNAVAVRIGGKEHRDWQSYDIDSDFLIPADGFDFDIGLPHGQTELPDLSGESCEVVINGEVVLTGIIDSQRHNKSKGSRDLRLSGRDLAALLVDCSAPQLNVQSMTVLDAAKKLAAPWPQIKAVVLKAEDNPKLDKIDIEPGETVWQALTHIANSVGLHPWFEPGGTLVVCEFSSPVWRPFRTVYTEYLMRALPPIATAVSSSPDAYVYLAESIRAWPDQDDLARKAREFRRKKLVRNSAIPGWYKQRHGGKQHVQSAAARVARFRPRASSSSFYS